MDHHSTSAYVHSKHSTVLRRSMIQKRIGSAKDMLDSWRVVKKDLQRRRLARELRGRQRSWTDKSGVVVWRSAFTWTTAESRARVKN